MAANPLSKKRVAVWVRVSTHDQAQGDSPEHHLLRGKQYAALNDWSVVETYDLAGVSGKSVWENEECQRMLKDVKRGHIQGLIFSKLARLARNTRELLDFADYFQEHGAALISLEEKFDTSTPAGRLFFTFVGAIASWEREEIAARVQSSMLIRSKLGKPMNGKSPYGFKWEKGKLNVVPEEAAIRREAFELFLKHRRKGTVARLLSNKGLRTREGALFRDMQIHRMLTCSSAIGNYRNNQWRATKKGKGMELKPESEWGSVPCDAIVSPDVYQRVAQIIEEQIKPTRKPGKPPAQIFSGLLRCSCGCKMYVYTRSPNYTCNKCKNKIPITTVEELFLGSIQDELTDTGRLTRHIEQVKNRIDERETEKTRVKRLIEQTQAEMKKTFDLYMGGGITVDGFKEINQPMETRLGQLRQQLPALEGEITALQVNDLSVEVLAHEARGLATLWPTFEIEDKQRLAALMCSEILIPTDPNEAITITLTTARPTMTDPADQRIPPPQRATPAHQNA
jgi:site-specific DNA recombinase